MKYSNCVLVIIKLNIEIMESPMDSLLGDTDIYPDAPKLSIAKVLLEWNQNNNVRQTNFLSVTCHHFL